MGYPIKQYKKKFDHSYSFGVYPTLILLENQPEIVIKVLLSPIGKDNSGLNKLIGLCQQHGIQWEYAQNSISRITSKDNIYAVGVYQKKSYSISDGDNHVVLVTPSSRGNLGTIIRTMVGFDFSNLAIISPAVDIHHPTVVRSSMGSVFQIKYTYYASYRKYHDNFAHTKYPLSGLAKMNINDVHLVKPYSFIFGTESSGLPKEVLALGIPVRISQSSKIDSLNLSVAAGIIMEKAYSG